MCSFKKPATFVQASAFCKYSSHAIEALKSRTQIDRLINAIMEVLKNRAVKATKLTILMGVRGQVAVFRNR